MTDKWTDRLSEYLDGELTPAETAALEAHLPDCAECTRTLEQLRAVVFRATQVVDRPPENDLWQGIAARIAQPADVSTVEILPQPRHRRVSFSIPQLAAASITLILLSSATMYLMLQRRPEANQQGQVAQTTPTNQNAAPTSLTPVATTPAPAPARDTELAPARPRSLAAPQTARAVSTRGTVIETDYTAAISELEAALRQNRARLDTATVRVLETNLRAIDNAIAEARDALATDPGNTYLNRYLDRTLQRKIQLLRRATGIVRARS